MHLSNKKKQIYGSFEVENNEIQQKTEGILESKRVYSYGRESRKVPQYKWNKTKQCLIIAAIQIFKFGFNKKLIFGDFY